MEQLGPFITNHWQLWLALAVIITLIFINELLDQKKRGKALTPAAAVDLINHNSATVFDLRDAEMFKKGHITDAIRASADDFKQNRMEKYKQTPLILVCNQGTQAATLATQLRAQGFKDPMVLAGGIAAWQTAGLPLVKGK